MAIDSMRNAYSQDLIRAVIEAQEKAEHDRVSELYAARNEGLQEGLEQGLEQGLEKGLEQGRERVEQVERERDAQRHRAEQLAAKLRELGVEPE